MSSTDLRPPRSQEPPQEPEPGTTTAAAAVPTKDGPAADRHRWMALVIMLVAVFMDMLDGSVVNVAIPTIQRNLGASYASIQWITAGYVLAFALLLITGGRLGDIYGRKRMFQLGVVGFTIASLLCGIASNPGILVGSRLLQGAMAGLMVPQVLSIIHVTFPNEEKGKVFAVHGMVGGIAATIAPLIGGVIVAMNIFNLDWRPIFLINVPVGILGYFLGAKYISESKASAAPRLDLLGVGMATIALLLLLYPLTFGRENGWPWWGYVSMVASAVVLWVFISYERRKDHSGGDSATVATHLFTKRSFSAGQVTMLAVYTFTGMFMLALYLFMQLGLGWSPLRAGTTMLGFCVGAFLTASASVIVLVPKFGRTVLHAGAVVIAIGLAVFLLTVGAKGANTTSWSIVPALFLIGLGFGATATPIAIFGLAEVPHEDAGSASGLINTMQQLGFTIGIALVSLSFFTPMAASATASVQSIAPQLRQELVTAGVPADRVDATVAAFSACATERLGGNTNAESAAGCVSDPQAAAIVDKYYSVANADTFARSFKVALWVAIGLVALVFLVVSGLPKRVSMPGAQ